MCPRCMGIILRTAAHHAPSPISQRDFDILSACGKTVATCPLHRRPPTLVYGKVRMIKRSLAARSSTNKEIDEIPGGRRSRL